MIYRLKDFWEWFGDVFGDSVIHPQFFAKRYARTARRAAIERAHGIVADVGCGRAPYRAAILAKQNVTKYLTIDHPEASEHYSKDFPLDVKADLTDRIPLEDRTVDTVLLLMVLEHVPQPSAAIAELHRILKPGGTLVLSTVFTHPVHDPPFDFYRYTRFGLERLLEQNGFELVELNWEGSVTETVVAAFNTTLFQQLKSLTDEPRVKFVGYLLAIPALVFATLLNLFGLLLAPLDTLHHLPHTVWAVARRPGGAKRDQAVMRAKTAL